MNHAEGTHHGPALALAGRQKGGDHRHRLFLRTAIGVNQRARRRSEPRRTGSLMSARIASARSWAEKT